MKVLTALLLPTALLLASCEYFYNAEIKNQSQKSVVIKVKFNRFILSKFWKGRSYIPFLESYPNYTNVSSLSFDTVNLVKTYKIEPESMFPLEGGMSKPDFELFESLTILSKDTIILKGSKNIESAFQQTNKYTWELKVK